MTPGDDFEGYEARQGIDAGERLAAAIERNARAAEADAHQNALRQVKADEFSRKTHRRHLLDEYRSAGVEPPRVDGYGRPMASLSMLLLTGWTIAETSFGGEARRELIPPPGGAR